MNPIIMNQLNKAEAVTIFEENAVLHGNADAIEAHRIVELFGEGAARFIERCTEHNGYLIPGVDYNATGACSAADPCLMYYFLPGFIKIVSDHNHRLQVIAHQQSEGGNVWETVWNERRERMEAEDRKNARKRGSRKAKAEAAEQEG